MKPVVCTHIQQLAELDGPEVDVEDVLPRGGAQLAAGVQRRAAELHQARGQQRAEVAVSAGRRG